MNLLLGSAVASLLFCQAAFAQEVVRDEPLGKDQLIATVPVLALRKLPADKVIAQAHGAGNAWMVSLPAAVGSATSSEQISLEEKEALTALGPSEQSSVYNTLQPSQKEAVAKALDLWTSAYDMNWKIPKDLKSFSSPAELLDKSKLTSILPRISNTTARVTTIAFPDGSTEQMDANAVGRILASNKIVWGSNLNTVGPTKLSYSTPADLDLDTDFANEIQATYFPLKVASPFHTGIEQLSAVSSAVQQAALNLPVAAALLINAGEAGFGTPLVYTSKDKSLSVEPSLARRYDVYWVELAFSPSEELIQNVSELRYDFAIGSLEFMALDLVPARIGVETDRTDTIKTPTIKMHDVEVGEMFSRTVNYKYIRPTILAHGVLTSSFGWIFRGQSLDPSAKRMFAVIGVPKGTKQVTVTLTLAAKCVQYLGLATEWASTGPISYTIRLP